MRISTRSARRIREGITLARANERSGSLPLMVTSGDELTERARERIAWRFRFARMWDWPEPLPPIPPLQQGRVVNHLGRAAGRRWRRP